MSEDNETKREHWTQKRKREQEEAALSNELVVEAVEETPVSEVDRIRQLRKGRKESFGSLQQKLALPLRANYHRHWFNDSPGRIEEANLKGWEHVKDKEGRPVKRIVGTARDGNGLYAYAMELPQEIWEEDQQEAFKIARAPLEAIKKRPIMAEPGKSQAADDNKFYSPREQILSISRG